MTDLNKYILASHATFKLLCKFRTLIIVQQILSDSCALCFPVTPNSHCAVVNVVASHNNINCSVHFYSCNLSTAKLHHIVDMVNVIIFDDTKYTTHTTDNSTLFTMMNIVSTNYMSTDFLFQPTIILSTTYRITLHLSSTFNMLSCIEITVFWIKVATHTNARAFATPDIAILNYPAFAPMRRNHTILICCWRSPCCCSFVDVETTYSNIINSLFTWHETFTSYCDFNIFLIRIRSTKIHIKNSLIKCIVLARKPFSF